jgi:Ni2+-binding GTPase involved in maturation of urease and hydrogenase
MKTKKKKREALKIAIILTVAAGKGGATQAVPTILRESYQTALVLLDELDRNQDDDKPVRQDREDQE